MAVVADLHVHTTNSDGELTIPELPTAARVAGLDCVAVTDHDRYHPELDAPVVEMDGLTVVNGIELRVEADDLRVDLLGYGVTQTDALTAEIDRIQQDRIERGAAIIDCVEDRLDVDLELEPREGLGRPHVARAIDESEAPYDYRESFDELIGDDGPCYVAREIPSFARGVELLSKACAVVGLAHPFRYDDVASALALTSELDAIERYYPYGREVDTDLIESVAADNDLLLTGGTDAHGTELGKDGLPREAFTRFAQHLPRAQS
ncbi:PHP domain-containing protein [Salinirubrum litoreum]|uniref:PHP domain-containing protein n=1 Tax=Salinirubrum litoreum TaxID=1126234 RepID=A0ABD5R9T4_9EURY|nr:PHP domain-containing protein [Salinirubrum litoreum]